MMGNNFCPKVSIVVITYCSASTIIETLDSIAMQIYRNIEIIVSDDASPDNTVSVCQKWAKEHSDIDFRIIETEQNTGVSGNLNRGLRVANGEWIKIMAGDDILFDYSILRFVEYVFKNKKEVCVSKLHFLGTNFDNIRFKKKMYDNYFDKYSKLDAKKQYRLMLIDCILPMPGMFISKKILKEIGCINERYPFAEEWPTYLAIMGKGYDIPYLNEELVGYRCEGNTLGSDQNNRLNSRVFNDTVKSFREFRRPLMLRNGLYLQAWNMTISYFVTKKTYYEGRNSKLWLMLFHSLHIFNPLKYIVFIRKVF